MRFRLALGLIAVASPALAQSLIRGVVREDSTNRPLENVEVVLEKSQAAARSDGQGRFTLTAKKGTHVAVFRRLGFKAERMHVRTSGKDTVVLDAVMVRQVQELGAVEVAEEPVRHGLRAQFYERQKLGLGKFIDSTELRRSEGRLMSDILRQTGLRLMKYSDPSCPYPTCDYQLLAANADETCRVSVVYDGSVIYRSGSPGRAPDFKKEFPAHTLEAIEYYRSTARMPGEFAGPGSLCGVLVLWSRRGH